MLVTSLIITGWIVNHEKIENFQRSLQDVAYSR